MNVIFYKSFSKRHNSTKIPTSTGDTYSVSLKKNTSFYSPSFLLEMTDVDLTYNYCQWEGRYYYVNDITLVRNNIFDFSCTFDALATYRSNILSYNAFVARASSSYNEMLPDNNWIPTGNYSSNISTTAISEGDLIGDLAYSSVGCYIMKVAGGATTSSTSGVVSYAISVEQLKNVLNFMFTESNFADVLSDAAVKAVFNPFQYILSLAWCPFAINTISTYSANVKFGLWESDGVGYIIQNTTANGYFNLPIPVFSRNDYRRYSSSYTKVECDIWGIGLVSLPVSDVTDSMSARYYIDLITGDTIVNVVNSNNNILGQYRTTLYVPIQIGQQNSMLSGILQLASGIGSFVSGNIAGGALGTINGVSDTVNPSPSVTSQQGSFASIKKTSISMVVTEVETSDLPDDTSGRPLLEYRTLSSLNGQYLQCLNASVPITGNETAKETINNTLNGGVYIE